MNDKSRPSDDRKHVLFSLKLAGFLIGASLLLTLGLSKGLISQGLVERAFGVLLGLSMAAYGNAIPKFIGTPPTTSGDAIVAQSVRRVSGWALALGFLLSAGLWAFAPDDVARIGSIVCPGLSAVVVLGFVIRKYLQCRKPRTRDISNSVLLLILAPLSAFQGQRPGLPFPVATPKSQGVAAEAATRAADEIHEHVRNGTVAGSEP